MSKVLDFWDPSNLCFDRCLSKTPLLLALTPACASALEIACDALPQSLRSIEVAAVSATDGAVSAAQISELARGEWIGIAD